VVVAILLELLHALVKVVGSTLSRLGHTVLGPLRRLLLLLAGIAADMVVGEHAAGLAGLAKY
jgi:hypothetical protein